jgi:DNA-binding PadR family transcriptional regulator
MPVNLNYLRISTLFIHEPRRQLWAYTMKKRLGMNVGTLMPALASMVKAGWLTSEEEPNYDRRITSRPQRRLYRITEHGISETRRLLTDLQLPLST